MKTPWGNSQNTETIAHGLTFVSTASHGGFKVSSTLNMTIPNWLKECTHNKQGFEGWYEEDCDWCIPAMVFHIEFTAWAKERGNNNYLDLAERAYVKHLLQDVNLPMMGERVKKKGLYLNLYHGRTDLSKDTNGWGREEPLIGPLTRLKATYLDTLTLTFCDGIDALRYGLCRDLPELTAKEGCILYYGVFYGDWSLEYHQGMIA